MALCYSVSRLTGNLKNRQLYSKKYGGGVLCCDSGHLVAAFGVDTTKKNGGTSFRVFRGLQTTKQNGNRQMATMRDSCIDSGPLLFGFVVERH